MGCARQQHWHWSQISTSSRAGAVFCLSWKLCCRTPLRIEIERSRANRSPVSLKLPRSRASVISNMVKTGEAKRVKNSEYKQSISVWNHTRLWCKAVRNCRSLVSFQSSLAGKRAWLGHLLRQKPIQRIGSPGWSWSYTPETQTISPGHSSPAFLPTLVAVPRCPASSTVTCAVKSGSGAQLCRGGRGENQTCPLVSCRIRALDGASPAKGAGGKKPD